MDTHLNIINGIIYLKKKSFQTPYFRHTVLKSPIIFVILISIKIFHITSPFLFTKLNISLSEITFFCFIWNLWSGELEIKANNYNNNNFFIRTY